jgi:hypothetical protein
MLTNSEWYDSDGRYVPLSERDIAESRCAIHDAAMHFGYVEDFTQIGGYIHLYLNQKVAPSVVCGDFTAYVEGANFLVDSEGTHTYRYLNGDRTIVLKMV